MIKKLQFYWKFILIVNTVYILYHLLLSYLGSDFIYDSTFFYEVSYFFYSLFAYSARYFSYNVFC